MQNLLLRRIIAYVIDCTILFFVLAPLGFAVQYIFDFNPVSVNEIYFTILVNFSIPVWTYFIYADYSKGGASLGKKFLGVKTTSHDGNRVTLKQACGRTAIKMLPWELSHIAGFLLVPTPGQFNTASSLLLGLVYLIVIIYLISAWRSNGRKSIHDILASTEINLITANSFKK